MKRILRILLITAVVLVSNFSCEDSNDFELLPEDEMFQVISPANGASLILDESNPQNKALTIVWSDNISQSQSYTIDLAIDEEFTNPISAGTSSNNTFSLTVGELNTLLLDAGVFAYEETTIYFRVTGGNYSDVLSLVVNSYPASNPMITNPSDNAIIALSSDTPNAIAMTVEWMEPDFSAESMTVIDYTVEVALAGTDFADPDTFGSTQAQMLEVTHSNLNNKAVALGIAPETSGMLEIRVFASLETTSGMIERYSNPVTINVTPFLLTIDLSTWGIVGSGYNNWGAFADAPFYTTAQPNVIVSYATLVTGEIKFRENNSWDNNFGDTGADGTLDAGGDNIAVTSGTYKITIDFNTNSYTIEPWSLGVVGSGYNDWGNAGPDAKFYYDYTTDTFKVSLQLLTGEIKFRLNNNWDINYGGSGGSLSAGGANIASTAGYYTISVDLNNLTYSITPDQVLGVVGSGYNDWGNAGPDFALTEVNPDIFVGDLVTLLDGEIKFRMNNDWTTNYGGTGGTLSQNGDNIAVTAGLYRIRVDLANNTYQINRVQ